MELRLQADETIMTRALVARRLFPSFCITCSVERKKAATVTSHVLFVGLHEANIAHITCSYSVTHRVGHPLRMYILALSIILLLGGSFPSQAGGGLETFFRSRQWWKGRAWQRQAGVLQHRRHYAHVVGKCVTSTSPEKTEPRNARFACIRSKPCSGRSAACRGTDSAPSM